jgi:hypothetical protein
MRHRDCLGGALHPCLPLPWLPLISLHRHCLRQHVHTRASPTDSAFRLRDSITVATSAAWIGCEVLVDITTRDLYDRIEFNDAGNGAWKQGWEVKYMAVR